MGRTQTGSEGGVMIPVALVLFLVVYAVWLEVAAVLDEMHLPLGRGR